MRQPRYPLSRLQTAWRGEMRLIIPLFTQENSKSHGNKIRLFLTQLLADLIRRNFQPGVTILDKRHQFPKLFRDHRICGQH